MQRSRFSTFTRSSTVAILLATVTGVTCAQSTDPVAQAQTLQAMQSGQAVPAPVPGSQGMQEALPSTATPSIVARPPQRPGASQSSRAQRDAAPRDNRPSEFMSFVAKVTGKDLPTFGSDLFANFSSNFTPLESTQVNPDYVIGTGDNLEIRGWGMIDIDVSAIVDRNGEIYIPRVGSVKVAGVKYSDLQGHLKKAVGRIFSNFELTASLSQTRAVQVYVVGHAARPGTYVLNSMNTLLNALFTSGGPNQTGSVRNIQLRRNGKVISNFDLYQMILAGDKSGDMSLKDGDVIFIPEVGPQVAVIGNVKKPAIYELTANATVADVLIWSGGIDSAATGKRVIVEKNINNRFESIADLTADEAQMRAQLGALPARPADILRVFAPGAVPVQAQVTNEYVRISGEAARTGVFHLEKNETLRGLVSRLGGVTQYGYVYATQLNREAIRIQQQERLNEIGDRFEREIDSAASRRLAGVTDRDSLAAITADIERQRELAQRMRMVRAEGRVVLEMADASAQVKNLPDIPLRDGDTVHIPRRPDTVDVLGAVFQQSTFIFKPNRHVKDYVKLAGGPTETADMSSMYVIRPDGTVQSGDSWFRRIGGTNVNPGDTIVIPENVDRSTWRQSLKEWTAIFYQFGLGAAGLKVLKD